MAITVMIFPLQAADIKLVGSLDRYDLKKRQYEQVSFIVALILLLFQLLNFLEKVIYMVVL